MNEFLSSTFLGPFLKNKVVRYNLIISLIFNIFIWIFLLFTVKNFDEIISLHYNIYFGIDLIKPRYYVLFLPLLGFAIIAINLFIASALYNFERLLSYFLSIASSFINAILFLAVFFIILVNL